MNRQALKDQAQRIYQAQQHAATQWAKLGVAPTGLMLVSADLIEQHLVTCAELSDQYRVTLDPDKLWGKSAAEITAIAESKVKKHNRRAGVRALVKKYGVDAAADIVKKHSGRTIKESRR